MSGGTIPGSGAVIDASARNGVDPDRAFCNAPVPCGDPSGAGDRTPAGTGVQAGTGIRACVGTSTKARDVCGRTTRGQTLTHPRTVRGSGESITGRAAAHPRQDRL
ncbi:hypothetical protein GCM10027416_26110 [Okibacterium endophyticum]